MSLLGELKRRKVLKIAAAYVVAAWVLIQVADAALPGLSIPDAAIRYVWIAAILGFPIAMAFSWRFDISVEGLRKTQRVEDAPLTPLHGLDYLVLTALCALTLGVIGWLANTLYSEVHRTAEVRIPDGPDVELDALGLAIMPFEYAGAASDDKKFLASGIYDNLMTAIGRIQAIRVVSRQTMKTFADSTRPISDIAAQLRVKNVLAGSVNSIGEQVVINVQLVDAANDQNIWAETFYRSVDPVALFDFQNEVVHAIAGELQAIMTSDESACIEIAPTASLEAYRLHSLGTQKLDTRRTDELPDAATYFENAIKADPGYAEAHVSLAHTYRDMRELTGEWTADDTEQRVRQLIDKALELNPCLGEAVAARAGWFPDKDAAWTESEFDRALRLSPNSAFVYELYGNFLHLDGVARWQESLEMYEHALRLHPLSPRLYVSAGLMLELLDRFGESEAYIRQAIEIDPRFTEAYSRYAILHWNTSGQVDEAVYWLRKSYAIDPSNVRTIAYTGWAYLDLGDDVEAERWFRQADRLGQDAVLPKVGLADVYHIRGQHDLELELLKMVQEGIGWDEKVNFSEQRILKHLVRDGRYSEASSLADEVQGLLSNPDDPISHRLMYGFIIRAQILAGSGETERAEGLWRRLEEYIDSNPPVHPLFVRTAAMVFAARHKKERALDLLSKAVEGGWRWFWWYYLEDPSFDSLRDDQSFQDIIMKIEADMSQQLANVREKERSGEMISLQVSD